FCCFANSLFAKIGLVQCCLPLITLFLDPNGWKEVKTSSLRYINSWVRSPTDITSTLAIANQLYST
ncbi:MAG: hypothetical protein ACRC1Z_03000, partial [Waterburya sp.]